MSTLYPTDHTAAEWREMAAESARRSQESWDRSDTDGFLSQWAGDVMSSAYRTAADVIERGGMAEEVAIFDLQGNLQNAIQVEGRYGWTWMVRESFESNRVVAWFNESNAQDPKRARANNAKKGYYVGRVAGPAVLVASGNQISVRYVPRIKGGLTADVTILDNGQEEVPE